MIVEIDVKEKWEIRDTLNSDNEGPYLGFQSLDGARYGFRGTWLSAHPTNPQLLAAPWLKKEGE